MNISSKLSTALQSAKYVDVDQRKRDKWNDKVSIVLEFMLSIDDWARDNNFCINSTFAHKQINKMLKSDKYDIAEISLSDVKTIMTEYKDFFSKVKRIGDGKFGKSVFWGYLVNKENVFEYIKYYPTELGMAAEDFNEDSYGLHTNIQITEDNEKMPWEE